MIPTYRRLAHLRRCLAALAAQTRRPDLILVIVRDTDDETRKYLTEQGRLGVPLEVITVTAPGQIAALNAGLAAVDSDIVAFTDDDAVPRPDWIMRLESHFDRDHAIGGVGGRDWIPSFEHAEEQTDVGRVQWFGRTIGNHHLGIGPARDVDVLKGANMSFRRVALGGGRFDGRLRGLGAQVHNELGLCLHLRREGWRLIYDPAIGVDHFAGPRFDYDQRDSFEPKALTEAVHNETLAILEHLPRFRRAAFLVWAPLVGTWAAPGLAQWVRFLVIGRNAPTARLLASYRGRLEGYRSWRCPGDAMRELEGGIGGNPQGSTA